jgi:outer membrane protein insertion porin family
MPRLVRALVAMFVLLFAAGHVAHAEVPAIGKIRFEGNRKTENDALSRTMVLHVGDKFDRERLREDVRAIWRLNYFDDVRVEEEDLDNGTIGLTFIVKEKPVIRKIYVAGNKEVGLDKINEVLDLKKDTIVDPSKIKRNVEKIKDVYVEKGYYLAEITWQLKRVDDTHTDVYFICDERAKVEVRQIRFLGNNHASADDLKKAMRTQESNWLSILTSAGTYREDAFEADMIFLTAYYYDKGYLNVKLGKPEIELSADKRFLYLTIPIEEGDVFSIGKIDFRGDLLQVKDKMLKTLAIKPGEMFSRTKVVADVNKVNDVYKDAGYAYVNVNPLTAVSAEKKTVDLTFDVQKGVPVYFGRIQIRGNTKTRDKVIRRELRIYEG